jgi:hypothetical protein
MSKWLACALTVLVVGAMPRQVLAQVKPYGLHDITELLKGGVSGARILALAERSCVTFEITPDIEEVLRFAGADAVLVAALRSVCRRPGMQVAEVDSGRAKPKTISKVVSPTVTSPVKTRPKVSGSIKYFRYALQTKSGDARYVGELPRVPVTGDPTNYYKIEYDRLGRPISERNSASTAYATTYYYTGKSQLADSSITENTTDASSRYTYKYQRDSAGNLVRIAVFSSGKLSHALARTIYGDRVEVLASIEDGSELYREEDTFSANGTLSRSVKRDKVLDYNYRDETEYSPINGRNELIKLFRNDSLSYTHRTAYDRDGRVAMVEQIFGSGDTTAKIAYYAGGRDTLERSTRRSGAVEEVKFQYDNKGRQKEIGRYRNGELHWKYVYEYSPVGTIERTLAVASDGQVLAEYPKLLVTTVFNDGHPVGHSDAGTVYKKPPWW